jgi:hypothetical protein
MLWTFIIFLLSSAYFSHIINCTILGGCKYLAMTFVGIGIILALILSAMSTIDDPKQQFDLSRMFYSKKIAICFFTLVIISSLISIMDEPYNIIYGLNVLKKNEFKLI